MSSETQGALCFIFLFLEICRFLACLCVSVMLLRIEEDDSKTNSWLFSRISKRC